MMKNLITIITLIWSLNLYAQIDPLYSPYNSFGTHNVLSDSNLVDLNKPLLFYYPETEASYPVFIFQLGANAFGSDAINRHSYDLFMKHLASYGFFVIIIDDSQAGLPSGDAFISTHNWFKQKSQDPTHWIYNYTSQSSLIIGGHSNGGVNASALLVDRPNEIDGIVFMDSYPSTGVLGFGAHDVSSFTGKELSLSAHENDPLSNRTGYESFTNTNCKTYVDIVGLDHGGFGDYDYVSQPVGPIGRDSATASIRHFFVSWMLSQFTTDLTAPDQLTDNSLHPNVIFEFENNCNNGFSSINKTKDSNKMFVYPNPSKNGIIHLNNSSSFQNLYIRNTLGEIVFQAELNNTSNTFHIGHLASGIYTVTLYDEKKLISQSIRIEN